MQRPVLVTAALLFVAAGGLSAVGHFGSRAAVRAPQAAGAGAAAPVWDAQALTLDEIKERIAKADIAETDRLQLIVAFRAAKEDRTALQSVLDKLRLAMQAAVKQP